MIGIIYFLFASYIMMAVSYTIESWVNIKNITKYWYLIPFALFWYLLICLLICWFYFPCDVGLKLYKKLKE